MPTYQYRCKDCGEELEVVQSFTDDTLTIHEACGGQLRKVFGNVGIAFKGNGFYKNDSRGKSSTTPARTDKAGESSSTNGDKSSTDGASSSTKDTGAATKKDTAAATSSSSPGKSDTAPAGSKSG